MCDLYQNKYRIKSHRKLGWDYSSNGYYFITLVCQHRQCHLGDIVNGQMILSDFGQIVKTQWDKSFNMRDELFLDTYIIMPNHLHAIVVLNNGDILDNNRNDNNCRDVETHGRASLRRASSHTPQRTPSHTSKSNQSKPPIRLPKSISSFVGGFKSAVNSKIDDFIDNNKLNIPKYNRNNHFFQANYHDHIIRNQASYKNISEYIFNNPVKWTNDTFNPLNLGKK